MRIDGTTSAKKRTDLVQAFQDTRAPGSPRVALLSINAAGVGITLTAAHHVIFAELSWTPGVLEQCVDRVHRLGQRAASVEIAYLVYGPFDDEMWFRLKAKQRVLDESGVGAQQHAGPQPSPPAARTRRPTRRAGTPPQIACPRACARASRRPCPPKAPRKPAGSNADM